MNVVRHPKQSESGASAVEYGLLVALIASAVILATFAIGQVVKKGFSDTCATIEASQTSASGQQPGEVIRKEEQKEQEKQEEIVDHGALRLLTRGPRSNAARGGGRVARGLHLASAGLPRQQATEASCHGSHVTAVDHDTYGVRCRLRRSAGVADQQRQP